MISGAGFSFSGIASGIDTEAIIRALVAVERRPIQMMEDRRDRSSTRSTEFGRFKNYLKDLDSALDSIKRESDFFAYSATSSDEHKATVSAGQSATAGSHSLKINSLASFARVQSNGWADTTSEIGSGSIAITYDGQTTDIALSNASLDDIKQAINDADIGVSASIINTGSATDPYQLIISGGDTGTAHQLDATQVDMSGFTPAGSALSFSNLSSATDALIEIDGIAITRGTNTVDDALEGVTFQLLDETAVGEDLTITVSADTSAIADKVEQFVTEFNDIISFIKRNTNYSDDGDQPVLFGESLLRGARQNLLTLATGTSIPANSGFENLSAIGITLGSDGRLATDRSKLEEKIAEDPSKVAQVFGNGAAGTSTGADGIAHLLQDYLDGLTDVQDGLVTNRIDMLDKEVSNYDKRILDAEARLELFEERQRQKFAGFESLMGGLQTQQQALLSAFSY